MENSNADSPSRRTNRLIKEKSPYLLKHAHNPVDWYPWGEEAFEKAKAENKLIFLSIGYSSCHWCNVMEKESYDDEDVGWLMNSVFVSIKVDREERPDLDSVYMAFCGMINPGGCGWPLNVILTPGMKPFFAATYIPKNSRDGLMGMTDLIPKVRGLWGERARDVEDSADKLTDALQNGFIRRPGKEPLEKNLSEAVEKFYQVGFGFHRYSVDATWLVPHFEKMLYTQALLAAAYTEAHQATGKDFYINTAKEIFAYVLRDMTDANGGFYSTEDADSEGEEGRFYVWKYDEIMETLGKDDGAFAVKAFGVTKGGNFIEQGKQAGGKNILHLAKPIGESAAEAGMDEKEFLTRFENARRKLFTARAGRVHPAKDDKILTDWNGLMIAALAKGARVFDDKKLASAAERAADFILKNARTPDGLLLHRVRHGEAAITGMLEDYAFFVQGLLELYEATLKTKYLREAVDLTNRQTELFWDEKEGGFFNSADFERKKTIPWKDFNDGDAPCGNSVSMLNLLRLERMTGDPSYGKKAAVIGRIVEPSASEYPSAHTQSLAGVDFNLGPSFEIVVAGKTEAADSKAMIRALNGVYAPNSVLLFRDDGDDEIVKLAPFTENQRSTAGKATAYVCQNRVCNLPTTDPGIMLELLRGKRPATKPEL
ncbi:MAG: thioredoxin domain-containing protein [Nitrospinae bacterium]|nr:thioredoxin domain-containing protein [Nitrospinota bacterium]